MNSRPESFLANRLNGVTESATLKLNAAVQALKAKGVGVINFSAGEPDFGVHPSVGEAVREAIAQGKSKYTPVGGVPELRKAVADKTNRDQPSVAKVTPWEGKHVIVSNGGKQAIFNAFFALLNPGDEMLVPTPFWLSYPEVAKLCGAVPKLIKTTAQENWKLTPSLLRAALTPASKLLVINSPSNPAGILYSRAELKALGDVLLERARSGKPVFVLSDEIYDEIVFAPEGFCSFLEACPELRDFVITVNGLSKSAAMTGWRVGWSVAPEGLTAAFNTIQGQLTSGISALTQAASIAALKLPRSYFEENRQIYLKRRDLALEVLKKTSKIEVIPPGGAFYLFVRVERALRGGEDGFGFAERLLADAHVAVVPGGPFGDDAAIRLSFATDERSIQDGCARIVEFVERN